MKDNIESAIDKLITNQKHTVIKEDSKLDFKEIEAKFDAQGLKAEIQKRLGFDVAEDIVEVKLEDKAGRHRNEIKIRISTQDLTPYIDEISKLIFKELYVNDFGSSVEVNEEGVIMGWVSVHFAYKHPNGGSNGSDFFDAWYDFSENKWTFRGKNEH